jgi:large subunit ribosomal protein L10
MPAKKILEAKQEVVKGLVAELRSAKTLVVADYRGLTVEQDTKLRVDLRKAGITYKVVKNTLASIAAKDAGLEGLAPMLSGPSAIAYSTTDEVAPAKVLKEFADKNDKYKIRGGVMNGSMLSLDEVKALAAIPPKEVLYAKVVFTLISPITKLAMVLAAIAEKQGEGQAPAEAPKAEAAPEAAPAAEAAPAETTTAPAAEG